MLSKLSPPTMSKAKVGETPKKPVSDEEFDIDDQEMDLEFLKGGYVRLNRARKESDARLDEVNQQLRSILKILEKQHSHPTTRSQSEAGGSQHQVYSQNWEQNRENQPLGYRSGNMNLANRESMLQKIQMPVFAGTQPYVWLTEVERWFSIGRYGDEEKLELVGLSLEGRVKKWFSWELKRRGFATWYEFKEKLILRFAESIEEEPACRLFGIKQTGSVADYISEFEELSELVPNVADNHLIKIFFNGLNQEMKEVIRMKEPRTLEEHISAVLRMESSAFCKVVSEATKNGTLNLQKPFNHPLKSSSNFNTQRQPTDTTGKQKQGQSSNSTTNPGVKDQSSGGSSVDTRPRMKFSKEELDKMRKESICFKCGAKGWTRAHQCPNQELRILMVTNGWEL